MNKKKVLTVISLLLIFILILISIGKYNSLKASKVYRNSSFTIGIIKDIEGSTRSNVYYYEYIINNIKYNGSSATYKQKKEKNSNVLIMFNKNRISESFLFENTIIPEEYLNKDTIWTTPPNFIDSEDLNFLNDQGNGSVSDVLATRKKHINNILTIKKLYPMVDQSLVLGIFMLLKQLKSIHLTTLCIRCVNRKL